MIENKKTFANLIKEDLKDILRNNNRWNWKLFFGYYNIPRKGGDIFVRSDNPTIEKAVRENALRNAGKRKNNWLKKMKEDEKKGAKYEDCEFKLFDLMIWPEELEKEDYNEIVNLINQVQQLWQEKYRQREAEINQKLASNPKLFLGWWESGTWAPADKRQGLTFAQFLGQERGKNYHLMLPKNHPALANLERKEGGEFYLIEGLESIPIEPSPSRSTGENNPHNFNRWVELNDKIVITPYNDNSEPRTNENKEKIVGICNKCGADYRNSEIWYYWSNQNGKSSWEKLKWFCGKCWKKEEINYRQQSNKKNPVHKSEPHKDSLGDEHYYYFENGHWISLESGTPDPNTSGDNDSKLDIKSLIQYFQKNSIRKISLKNGELVITHNNNNETVSKKKVENDQELQRAKDMVQRSDNQELTIEGLERMLSNNSSQPSTNPSNNNALWMGIGIGGGLILIIGIMVGWLARKKVKNK